MRERALCVLRGDIKDFSGHMQGGGRRPGGVGRAARRRHGTRGALPLVGGERTGDALLVVHDDPNALISVASRLSEDLLRGPRPAAAPRGAGSRSPAGRRGPGDGRVSGGWGGAAVAPRGAHRAARGARRDRGATDEFRKALEARPTRYQATPVPTPDGGVDGAVNVKKPGSTKAADLE